MDQEELINLYLEGRLSSEDRAIFEKLLDDQPEYRQLLEEQRKIKIAVTLEERQSLRDFLQEVDQQTPKVEKSRSLKSWLLTGVAACVIVLAGFFIWTNLSLSPGEKLYKAFYETYPNLVAPTVRSESVASLKTDAFLAFDNQDYEKAAVLFENLSQEPNSEYAIFYLGICLLELERPEKAIPLFQQVSESAENPDKTTAEWYEALGYLKLDKLEEAKALISKVAGTSGHSFQSQAQELQEILQ